MSHVKTSFKSSSGLCTESRAPRRAHFGNSVAPTPSAGTIVPLPTPLRERAITGIIFNLFEQTIVDECGEDCWEKVANPVGSRWSR